MKRRWSVSSNLTLCVKLLTQGPKQSPAVSDFVSTASTVPLYLLPAHLRKFPSRWPLPRGDLYHWISVLNRFDNILEHFIKQYGLDLGPQAQPFGNELLLRGIEEESKAASVVPCTQEEIKGMGFSADGDRELVEEVLQFSRTLLENCGNRSLYSSSERLSDLLDTTSLSLLSTTLHLMVRLAQRYHASRQRSNNANSALSNALLASHYNIDLEKVQKIAEPFVKLSSSEQTTAQILAAKGKGKEKALPLPARKRSANANDMLSLLQDVRPSVNGSAKDVKLIDMPKSLSPEWEEWGGVLMTWTSSGAKGDQNPITPTPARRPSNLAQPNRLAGSDKEPDAASSAPEASDGKKATVHQVEFPYNIIDTMSIEEMMNDSFENWPKDVRYEILARVRVARAIIKSLETRQEILGIRLLAVTNLAYIYNEDTFKQKILQRDSDEPRNLQLVHQLSGLLQPPPSKASYVPINLQTLALGTLEALAKHKARASDVASALSVNVSHGVLFYLLRKAVSDMGTNDAAATDTIYEEWREALFSLLETLPSSSPRTGEALIGAGVLDILIEVLNLRTQKAERSYPKTLTFLNNLVGPIREAFQTLANAKGLEAISNLMAYEVTSAMERAGKGDGLSEEYRNRVVDYHIPFFSQQTLRMVFKIISQMMSNNSGNFDRLLRNFIDSPSLLSGLRTVIVYPRLFGSSVWSGAVNIMSSFIHNEPTSYAVISEAGISKGFLETLSTKSVDNRGVRNEKTPSAPEREDGSSSTRTGNESELPDPSADTGTLMTYFNNTDRSEARPADSVLAKCILPATDAIVAIPHAFGAICLNHAGMDMFKKSNAFDNFFEIFESPVHVKSMTSERELATLLGSSFDELVRHHPALKIWVLSSLLKMISRIRTLCMSRGKRYNSGAQLWLKGKDGQFSSAEETSPPHTLCTADERVEDEDVVMADVPSENAELGRVLLHDGPASQDGPTSEDSDDKNTPTTLTYLNVAMKFLSSFVQNPQMCNAFVDAGGAERILELATLPTLPYDFNIHEAAQEIMKVMHLLAEARPHLVLPALLQRTQAAVETLAPLYNYDGNGGFFEEFTPAIPSEPESPKDSPHATIGTSMVQSLVHVHTFGNILFEIFTSPPYTSRSAQTPFSQVNLTDLYRNLIKSFGPLHRSCVWECLLVQKRLPDSWRQDTRVKGFGMGGSEADEVLGFIHTEEAIPDLDPIPNDNNANSISANTGFSPSTSKRYSPAKNVNTAAFKNMRTLRFLLTQIPSTLVQFLRSLGKLLLGKRRVHNLDSYFRQNASIVADAISEAGIAMFTYEAPHKTGGKDLHDYLVVIMTSIAKVIIDDQPQAQVSTLLLQSFKKDGGLNIIKHVLTTFHDEINSVSESADSELLKTANRGIHVILEFYTQILSQRSIVDASQSQALQTAESRPGHAFYFNPHQFLLELRMAVIPVAKTLWESPFIEKADSSIIRCIIEIMKTLLDASEEHRIPRQMPETPTRNHKIYEIMSDRVKYLTERGFNEDVAREALYRCMNAQQAALAYCQRLRSVPGATRLPIPDYDIETPQPRSSSQSTSVESTVNGQQAHLPTRANEESAPELTIDEDTTAAATGLALLSQANRLPFTNTSAQAVAEGINSGNRGSPGMPPPPPPPPAPGVPAGTVGDAGDGMEMSLDNLQSMLPMVHDGVERVLGQLGSEHSSTGSPSRSVSRSQETAPQASVTVEDLKTARDNIGKDLVDRALDVLNAHNDVTFELADLIRTATAKASDVKGMRGEIGATLLQSLMSLGEDFSSVGKKIAAYANLLALVLQDKVFFEASSGELKENFPNFIRFVKVSPDQTLGMSTTPWVGQALLVMEKILAEDAQPPQLNWTPPGPDGPSATNDVVQPDPPLLSDESKSQLFEALLELMPHTKKDEPMVLAIARVLVILTRNRNIASRLAEKKNIQRLFLMIKQLSGVTDDRLTGTVMTIIRHMFEDEEAIRRIMRSEIRNNFETRPNRPMDAQGYARALNHLAIRSPEIFVEVSNEVLEISGYDFTQRPQALKLKSEPDEPIPPLAPEDSKLADSMKKEANEDQVMQDKTPSIGSDQAHGLKNKVSEKAPVVERPSGVIHYLLTELLGYKDADDTVSSTPAKHSNGDITFTSGNEGQSGVQGPTSGTAQPATQRSISDPTTISSHLPRSSADAKRTDFKPDQHPIHMYRCFILQCLTELLYSYNQAKVEFINFSRKADAKATTPSKPRSGVLNYLLNEAIPEGPINVDKDTVGYLKKNIVSNWAMSAIVALCSKTNELGYDRKPGTVEEDDQADLVFVRKFVLEHALKAYKDVNASEEDLNMKYGRLSDLADLFHRLLQGALIHKNASPPSSLETGPQKAIAKIMFEKNFIVALTSSIADINLNFKNVEKAIKYILRPLKQLTSTAVMLSETTSISTTPGPTDEDEISSATSVSEVDDGREETPDLFRNSTLGMFEPGREEASSSESSRSEDDEMFDDDYYEGMEEEDDIERDADEVISDEDEELGEVGPVEGLHGDRGMDVEVVIDDDDDDDEDPDESGDSDDIEEMDEINGDGENASLADGEEEEWQDEIGGSQDDEEQYTGDDQDTSGDQDAESAVRDIVREFGGAEAALQRLEGLEDGPADLAMDIDEGRYMDDVIRREEEDEADEDEDEEDMDDEEFTYEAEYDDERGMPDPPWGWDDPDDDPFPHDHHHHHHHHHHHRHPGHRHLPRSLPDPWTIFSNGAPTHRGTMSAYRSHRNPITGSRSTDDGTNPLLRRSDRSSPSMNPRNGRSALSDTLALSDYFIQGMDIGDVARDGPVSIVHNLIQAIGQGNNPAITAMPGPGGALHVQLAGENLPRELQAVLQGGYRQQHISDSTRPEGRSSPFGFAPQSTFQRWIDEAKMLFGAGEVQNRGQRVTNALLRLMVPPALEKKKTKDEEDKRQREELEKLREQERKGREDNEKKEREQREKEETEAAAEAAAAAQARAETEAETLAAARDNEGARAQVDSRQDGEEVMEGVESSGAQAELSAPYEEGEQSAEREETQQSGPSQPAERQFVTFNGTQLDITDMGIDMAYLDALPEDIRNEVLMSQLAMQRAQTAATGEAPTEIDNDFLEALPADIRAELLQQEAQERRRREREEARRQQAAAGGPARAEEMDPASFLASLDPQLRQHVLMEQDEEMLAHLPEEIAAEARALGGDRSMHRFAGMPRVTRPADPRRDMLARPPQLTKNKPRKQIVQMLDKAGIATLLRLMFVPQQRDPRDSLNRILHDVAQNRQNRAEVISLLLSILQDGSSDVNAVERSFTQLSLRAKQVTAPKTPLKRTTTDQSIVSATGIPELKITPLMVIQQCLGALVSLTNHNPHVTSFFLSENDLAFAVKNKANRKGKSKETKASKFPINALLSLLDRTLITENMGCVEQLASLLQTITHPLTMLLRREREPAKEGKLQDSTTQAQQVLEDHGTGAPTAASGEPVSAETTNDIPDEGSTSPMADVQATSISEEQAPAEETENSEPKSEEASKTEDKTPKKTRILTPPTIPDENLCLVVNIIVARECPSNTFRATLSTMTNLCALPGAKNIFGKRLVESALDLGRHVLDDLNELIPQVKGAASGTDLQGMALTKFSPQSSDQAKLLRVLKALDYLFDPKREDAKSSSKPENGNSAEISASSKADLVTSLYEDTTFALLWDKLGECLSAIRLGSGMLNIATILLPLIEALMVVCTNTTIKDACINKTAKEFTITSPPPESRMESLFFRFTEEHRKILNDLVRHNPKLMSGTFQLLVKNPKVLEFDNKRNYFARRLHSRSTETRHPQPPLQLAVRRDQVFLDSFKFLSFKTGDEIKYGKLSIRFHGEEGVDAGGVTREWFQVLSRQMFNPDYALFIPVASDRTTFHPNKLSKVNEEHLMFFKFIGRIIGKALYEGRALDCHFSRAVYKRILRKTVSIKDMETLDLDYYKSLLWMLENDITEIITETMSVETDDFGVTDVVDLVPNGRNIPVTEENKQEYVQRVVEYRLTGSVQSQLEKFLEGKETYLPQ